MQFEKWEALGNDFVLIDASAGDRSLSTVTAHNQLASQLCDRRRGIGADGVLVIELGEDGVPRMHVWNADGSRAAMCGNGARCVAAYVALRTRTVPCELSLQTDAGVRRCRVEQTGPALFEVAVDMGRAEIRDSVAVDHAGRPLQFRRVSMGNPHHVSFDPLPDGALDVLGPHLDAAVAGGTNVELVRSGDADAVLEVSVWERGAGRTLACGTGACAAAAVAVLEGRRPAGEPLSVQLPGGRLLVTVAAESLQVELRGPARRVFVGEHGV